MSKSGKRRAEELARHHAQWKKRREKRRANLPPSAPAILDAEILAVHAISRLALPPHVETARPVAPVTTTSARRPREHGVMSQVLAYLHAHPDLEIVELRASREGEEEYAAVAGFRSKQQLAGGEAPALQWVPFKPSDAPLPAKEPATFMLTITAPDRPGMLANLGAALQGGMRPGTRHLKGRRHQAAQLTVTPPALPAPEGATAEPHEEAPMWPTGFHE